MTLANMESLPHMRRGVVQAIKALAKPGPADGEPETVTRGTTDGLCAIPHFILLRSYVETDCDWMYVSRYWMKEVVYDNGGRLAHTWQ